MTYEDYANSLIEAHDAAEERAKKRREEVTRVRAKVEQKMRALCAAFKAHRVCDGCPAFLYDLQKKHKVCDLENLLGNNPEVIANFLKRTPDNREYESATIIAIAKAKELLDNSYGGAK